MKAARMVCICERLFAPSLNEMLLSPLSPLSVVPLLAVKTREQTLAQRSIVPERARLATGKAATADDDVSLCIG